MMDPELAAALIESMEGLRSSIDSLQQYGLSAPLPEEPGVEAPFRPGLLGSLTQRQNGGRVRITAPTTTTTITDTVFLLAADEKAPDPNAVIVTLGRRSLEERPASNWWGIRARIRWGAGRAANEILCDYHHGTRLTLDASSLQVDVQYVSLATNGATRGPNIEVSATAVYGQVGNRNLTLTDAPLAIGAGATTDFITVPQFARSVSVFTSTGGTTLTYQFANSKAADVFVVTNVVPGTKIDIPNGIEFFRVTNAGGAQDLIFVWELEL